MNVALLHLVTCWAVVGQAGEMPANRVFDTLVTQGVLMPDGSNIKLPPPIMSETMTADEQAKALALTAAAAKKTVAEFTAKDSVAPIFRKVQTLHTAPTYRTIDIAFVAHGKWSVLTDPNFGKTILKDKKPASGPPNDSDTVAKAGFLDVKEMAARGLKPIDDFDNKPFGRKEAWLQTTFNLFSQAQVSATRHVIVTKGPSSALFAALIDPRFNKDAVFPNQWRVINPGAALGPPQPYSGAGFYIKAVNLAALKDAIFFEYHSIYYEPHGWFNGDKVIESNLYKAATFQVKQFRIKLLIKSEAAEENKPASEENAAKDAPLK